MNHTIDIYNIEVTNFTFKFFKLIVIKVEVTLNDRTSSGYYKLY